MMNYAEDLDAMIGELASILLTGNKSFEQRATELAGKIVSEELHYLSRKLHHPPEVYRGIKASELGLGQWMALCQYAVFELIYNLDTPITLPLLKRIAFGAYDWTQATALEVLCRLYVNDRINKDILTQIEEKIPNMRYETHLYFARSLLLRSQEDIKYLDIIRQIKDDSFEEALEEVKEAE